MKISFYWVVGIFLIIIPIGSYVDVIRIGTFTFKQYLVINLWEVGILLLGIIFGQFIRFGKEEN